MPDLTPGRSGQAAYNPCKQYHRQIINGIHSMAAGWDVIIPHIIMEADLVPSSYVIRASMH